MLSLRLLSSFELARGGDVVDLPLTAQRVVAFLTLQDRSLQRSYVAGTLWPETTDQRAAGNLRSALWRLKRDGFGLVDVSGSSLRLAAGVRVDLRETTAEAHRLLDCDGDDLQHLDESPFRVDLLPDWYDDWLVIDRECFHQLRLRALECACERLIAHGSFARALGAGLAAVAGEPLRESAHRALIKVHLAEGNRAEAVRQLQIYRQLLSDQLGLAPSPQILALVQT